MLTGATAYTSFLVKTRIKNILGVRSKLQQSGFYKTKKLDKKFIDFNRVTMSKNSDANIINDFIGKSTDY
jgi:hypothetical protein